jgi:hypothetical protein
MVPSTDPPIIIHGGSLHLDARSATGFKDGKQIPAPITINALETQSISLGNYYSDPQTPVNTFSLVPNWQIDVCEGLITTSPNVCQHGFRVCSTPACTKGGNTKPPGTTFTITSIPSTNPASPDQIFSSDMRQQFGKTQFRYRVLDPQSSGDSYHPRYMLVYQGLSSDPKTYTCGPDPTVTHDWEKCWIALGTNPSGV